MIPISGSAYTYAYATLGEFVAWIIGWDLIIEYAVGNVAVAISWANYFKTLMSGFGVVHSGLVVHGLPDGREDSGPARECAAHFWNTYCLQHSGIRYRGGDHDRAGDWNPRERQHEHDDGAHEIDRAGLFYCGRIGLHEDRRISIPFTPNGWSGVQAGAAIVFFAYIGFDAVSTVAEETRKPARDLPIGIIGSLVICT